MITQKKLDPKGNRFFEVVTEPSTEPVTAEQVKLWARIDGTDEDSLIEGMITSVRKNVENYLNRSLISQKIDLIMDYWPGRVIELPRSPAISIDSITTLDEDGTATTYSSSNYYLINTGVPSKIALKDDSDEPENDDREYAGFKITYYAGYGTAASDVPQAIRDAIKMWVTEVYENRVISDKPPAFIESMLFQFRINPT